jgi:hypothetical protein
MMNKIVFIDKEKASFLNQAIVVARERPLRPKPSPPWIRDVL